MRGRRPAGARSFGLLLPGSGRTRENLIAADASGTVFRYRRATAIVRHAPRHLSTVMPGSIPDCSRLAASRPCYFFARRRGAVARLGCAIFLQRRYGIDIESFILPFLSAGSHLRSLRPGYLKQPDRTRSGTARHQVATKKAQQRKHSGELHPQLD